MLLSLQAAREFVNKDRSVLTSVSTGWFEWHNEFEASHAAMISSFAPHIPGDAIRSPDKFGKDKPFAQTVGMALRRTGRAASAGSKRLPIPLASIRRSARRSWRRHSNGASPTSTATCS